MDRALNSTAQPIISALSTQTNSMPRSTDSDPSAPKPMNRPKNARGAGPIVRAIAASGPDNAGTIFSIPVDIRNSPTSEA